MYYPSLNEFKNKTKEGNLIQVYKEIFADLETPVTAFKKIDEGSYSFLLESVEGGEKWGRYSFLGVNPSLIFRSKDNRVEIIRGAEIEIYENVDNPLNILNEILGKFKPVITEGLPRFYGGAVGYIGYEIIRFFEDIPKLASKDIDLYDTTFILTETILIFDNITHRIKVVSNVFIEDENIEESYERAKANIDNLISKLRKPIYINPLYINDKEINNRKRLKLSSNFTEEGFKNAVNKAKEYIRTGDIIQVVLSQRFETEIATDPFNIYRTLRTINPSPYMFYLRLGEEHIVGSSPEVLVRVEGPNIEIKPIAGTRRRGISEEDDERLESDLLKDPKERAEHLMLVDLGRNDVGRVADIGSVKVKEFMAVEKYSHVMHIVSHIEGILKEDKGVFDALMATFPAGTLTGAPKVRAMEIIEELEPVRRGIYGGAVGYFSFSKNMDMCIAIRTIVIKDGKLYIQTGAGIVADSDPDKEYQETINKAKALISAIELAREGSE
jgi:anthranilate synthase component 1